MKKRLSLIGIVFISSLIMFMTGCPTAPADEEKDDNTTEAVLDSIYISKEPNKTNYEYNAVLNLTGLEVKAKYNDKTEKIITEWTSNPKNGTKLTTSGSVNIVISYQTKTTSFRINVSAKPNFTTDQYFWGTWIRMDNGNEYVIDETSMSLVDGSGQTNSIISSSTSELSVSNLGTFKKQTSSVMKNGTIPYFRKGGSNLSYTMQLVGFEDNIQANRAAGTSSTNIKSKSKKFASYSQETTPEEDGTFTLNAPIAGDEQIISVDTENGLIIVTGIKIENDGSNLGTIPLSTDGQYSLKVTGTIDEGEKDNGYLYGNNYKEYSLTLTITNISDVTSAPSTCTITPKDPRVTVRSTDGSDINGGVLISTLKKGFTKTISLAVECGSITEGYIDTGLIVNVKNAETERNWQDFVPLRFYGGLVPVTIAAESVENNTDAALNGFVIYPDGNSQFFSVPQGGNKTVYVPSFRNDKKFIIAFSGATIQGTLSNSTEMLYTVAIGSSNKKTVDMKADAFSPSVKFGEGGNKNETEDTAFEATEDFQAYLSDGEIDYFKFGLVQKEIVYPGFESICQILYINEHGDTPVQKSVSYNSELTSNELPSLSYDNYVFDGWYIGNSKITEGYRIQSDITLTAKWKPIRYIDYELNGGTNNPTNPNSYSIEDTEIILQDPIRQGYEFEGWYFKEDYSDDVVKILKLDFEQPSGIKLYAKWKISVYSITYELNNGENNKNNPATYTIEDSTIVFEDPYRYGYEFDGWYLNEKYEGNKLTQFNCNYCGNLTIYAKWNAITYSITYVLDSGAENTENPISYSIESGTITLKDPKYQDYRFVGWYDNAEHFGYKIKSIDPTKELEDKVLYAYFTNELFITSHNVNTAEYADYSEVYVYEDVAWSVLCTKLEQYKNIRKLDLSESNINITTRELRTSSNGYYYYESYLKNTNIRYLVLPKELEYIVDWAFYDCHYLETVILPTNLKGIGKTAFEYCGKLKNIILPEGLQTIGDFAFDWCSQLNKIILPSTLESLGHCSFVNTGLTEITMNDGLKTIGENCFGGNNFSSIIIPSSVTDIGAHAFRGGNSLEYIKFPSSLTKDYFTATGTDYLFREDNKVVTIEYESTMSNWNYVVSNKVYTDIKKVICTDGVIEY